MVTASLPAAASSPPSRKTKVQLLMLTMTVTLHYCVKDLWGLHERYLVLPVTPTLL